MVTIILASIGLLLVAFLVVVAFRSSECKVQRSIVIKASAEKIFSYINDFKAWSYWSPWEKMDSNMKKEFSGSVGVDSTYRWNGNNKVGEGRMTILESKPNEKVKIALEFFKPYHSESTTTFTITKGAEDTQIVTWTMECKLNYFMKAMTIFKSMDSMIGKDFETGLQNLKAVV